MNKPTTTDSRRHLAILMLQIVHTKCVVSYDHRHCRDRSCLARQTISYYMNIKYRYNILVLTEDRNKMKNEKIS